MQNYNVDARIDSEDFYFFYIDSQVLMNNVVQNSVFHYPFQMEERFLRVNKNFYEQRRR